MSETQVPERYQPDPRPWEDKAWLYERYWGELMSIKRIAAMCAVSYHPIREALVEHGIPRRHPKAAIWGMPTAGFREPVGETSPDVTIDWGDADD